MAFDISKLRLDKDASVTVRSGGQGRAWRRPALIGGLALAVMVIIFLASPWRAEVRVVAVSRMYPYQGLTLLNASGYVAAQRKAAVASKVSSRLIWLGVEEGSRIKQGEVIAKLESDDKQALLQKARADMDTGADILADADAELADATLNYQRISELFRRAVVARADLDTALARIRKARAAHDKALAGIEAAKFLSREAEAELEYTLIRAPFDAVVLTKNADVGDIVTPLAATVSAKASVVNIADLGSLMVEVDVSESSIEKVKSGSSGIITLDALPEERFAGRVHMIVPTADRTKATVLVKVAFERPDDRVLPEMSAKVAFLERPLAPGEEAAVTVAPQACLAERGGRTVVFVLSGERLVERPVEIGGKLGDMVRLVLGVNPGDLVVLGPAPGLSGGDKVAVHEAG